MSMSIWRQLSVVLAAAALLSASPAYAQKVTKVEELTLRQALSVLSDGLAARPAGEAIAATTALELATMPFGSSSGGFVFKLDPSTGLLARTATTFGPAFAERAITSGEGQVSVGVSYSTSTYDKLSDLLLSGLRLGAVTANSAAASRTGTADLEFSSKITTVSGTIGVSENLDIGFAIPTIAVKLVSTSTLVGGNGIVHRIAEGTNVFAGLGDVAAMAKYRFVKFGTGFTDPGGIAVVVNMRLPTGDRENLRGLGITRTMVSGVVSGGTGRIRPHANAGFEIWSKSLDIATNPATGERVQVRHQMQYAAGIEVEANPKVTLLVDFLGQHIRGGGQVGYVTDNAAANASGITAYQSLVLLGDNIQKALLVPGIKVNLKGKMLLSVNAITTLKNNGLRATVTPVVGLNLTL